MDLSAKVLLADQVDLEALNAFLVRMYPPKKSAFLAEYGAWWHGGAQNRFVLLVEDVIAGYCAVIPTHISIWGQKTPAIWWEDLIIDSQYRGQGYQRLFDDEVRKLGDLKLGFPNALAAKIHRKHGWGVREDLNVMLMPINPSRLRSLRGVPGLKGSLVQMAARMLDVGARAWRKRLGQYQPIWATRLENPTPERFAELFHQYNAEDVVTTWRDADHFQWRFFDSPFRDELGFYVSVVDNQPVLYMITRSVQDGEDKVTRILDTFGDFDKEAAMSDLIRLVARDAVLSSSAQVTVMVTQKNHRNIFRRSGFWLQSTSRFCWDHPAIHQSYGFEKTVLWGLADSDNDSPD